MRISELPAATPTSDETELVVVVQGGVTKKMTIADLNAQRQALGLYIKTVSLATPAGIPNDGDEWITYVP